VSVVALGVFCIEHQRTDTDFENFGPRQVGLISELEISNRAAVVGSRSAPEVVPQPVAGEDLMRQCEV
jgi:hypothetical protein